MRLDPDSPRGDEWPNLSELEDAPVTDQDRIPRFTNGDPIHPIEKPRRSWHTIGVILFAWVVVVTFALALFLLLAALLAEARAHADESVTKVFEQEGECYIDFDLRVSGRRRSACVEHLEAAARIARGELRVNERRGKK
jgi:hypothetical protein